uniref:Uncharacterized protein n=1 Tax=Anguilla anguilla TaxID=7936 RepID=A0A0E9WWS4_ANGAN
MNTDNGCDYVQMRFRETPVEKRVHTSILTAQLQSSNPDIPDSAIFLLRLQLKEVECPSFSSTGTSRSPTPPPPNFWGMFNINFRCMFLKIQKHTGMRDRQHCGEGKH